MQEALACPFAGRAGDMGGGWKTRLHARLHAPGLNTPGLNTPGLNTPGLNTPGLNTPGLNTPGLNTSRHPFFG
jgi:hypothetical protein